MNHEYMKQAIELSKKGIGYTSPNPLVGALIVKDDRVIGQGYHRLYGGPHAEINAFNSATEDVRGATMYVTLEPCSHYGQTPPCANTIVEKGISKVIIGMKDPNPLVAGRGIEILRENGIDVVSGILEDDVKKLNEIFIKYITTKRPFCILKTAMTLDGKIATKNGDSKWITNEKSRRYVHEIRHRVSAIMVGVGTVIADDPMLNTRLEDREGLDPTRIIIDTRGDIPLNSRVLHMESKAKTIIVTTDSIPKEKIEAIKRQGSEVIITHSKDGNVDLEYLMERLGERKIDSVLIEGGSEVNFGALKAGIVNKVLAFIAPKILGGRDAKTPVGGEGVTLMKDAIHLHRMNMQRFDEDILIEAYLGKEE